MFYLAYMGGALFNGFILGCGCARLYAGAHPGQGWRTVAASP
jgi:hypothetical protein